MAADKRTAAMFTAGTVNASVEALATSSFANVRAINTYMALQGYKQFLRYDGISLSSSVLPAADEFLL